MTNDKCLSCGMCCQYAIVPPFTKDELNRLDTELAKPILDFRAHKLDPSKHINDQTGTRVCSWFVDGKCKHYNIRPLVCKEFEVDGTHCKELVKLLVKGNICQH